MSKMSRDKGKRGERAVIDWLQPILDEIYEDRGLPKVLLQRNTIQSDRGGSDLAGLDWLAAEVKNVEGDSPSLLADWWTQCYDQATEWSKPGKILTPVLFYKRNNRPFRIRMPGFASAHHQDEAYAYCVVDISMEAFEVYFRKRVVLELEKDLAAG